MDIKGNLKGPAGALSNFTAYEFTFDGVLCACAEGVLQAFKCKNFEVQKQICTMTGKEAKAFGQEFNQEWKEKQVLWWKGIPYNRNSSEYQRLLDELYAALSKNEIFCQTLLSTGNEVLTHSIGEPNPEETVLTEKEFCSRLMKIREMLTSTTS